MNDATIVDFLRFLQCLYDKKSLDTNWKWFYLCQSVNWDALENIQRKSVLLTLPKKWSAVVDLSVLEMRISYPFRTEKEQSHRCVIKHQQLKKIIKYHNIMMFAGFATDDYLQQGCRIRFQTTVYSKS